MPACLAGGTHIIAVQSIERRRLASAALFAPASVLNIKLLLVGLEVRSGACALPRGTPSRGHLTRDAVDRVASWRRSVRGRARGPAPRSVDLAPRSGFRQWYGLRRVMSMWNPSRPRLRATSWPAGAVVWPELVLCKSLSITRTWGRPARRCRASRTRPVPRARLTQGRSSTS